jgi:hypothetical protein
MRRCPSGCGDRNGICWGVSNHILLADLAFCGLVDELGALGVSVGRSRE